VNESAVAVGYATWFHTYSTFLAKPTMYLEDLFVREDARESGAGSALFEHVRTRAPTAGAGAWSGRCSTGQPWRASSNHRRQAMWMKDWASVPADVLSGL
jgi:GNAT superfamily N-acetyltransferase